MKATLISSTDGDWMGLYKDDKLVAEGHSIALYTALRFFVDLDYFTIPPAQLEGRLPDSLKELL